MATNTYRINVSQNGALYATVQFTSEDKGAAVEKALAILKLIPSGPEFTYQLVMRSATWFDVDIT